MKKIKTIDLSNCGDGYDVIIAFTNAKVNNGIAIEPYELKVCKADAYRLGKCIGAIQFTNVLIGNTLNEIPKTDKLATAKEKKSNIFKRLWNRVTRKK